MITVLIIDKLSIGSPEPPTEKAVHARTPPSSTDDFPGRPVDRSGNPLHRLQRPARSAGRPTDGRRTLAATAPGWASAAPEVALDARLSATVLLADSATPAEASAARSWLQAVGIDVVRDRESIRALSVTGSASAFASAFDTAFGQTTVDGRAAVAPTRDLSVPREGSAIESVAGLVDTDAMNPSVDPAPVRSDDCAAYWGQTLSSSWPSSVQVEHRSNALCGYGPTQLRAVHRLPADARGAGATVAIVGVFDDDTVAANTDTYFAREGLSTLRDGQYTHHAPANPNVTRCGGPSAWTVEQHLDVQAVRAMAPDADIVYWGADDCLAATLYLRVLDAVEAPTTPSVVSLSFGGPEELDTDADRTLLNRVLVEAASRGVSVFASSGNDGDYSLAGDHHDETDVATPASSPYVTAVGGASIGLDADNGIAVESGWEVQTRFAQNGGIIPPASSTGPGAESRPSTRAPAGRATASPTPDRGVSSPTSRRWPTPTRASPWPFRATGRCRTKLTGGRAWPRRWSRAWWPSRRRARG